MRKKKRKNFVFVLLLLLCLIIPFSTVTVFSAQFYWGRNSEGGSVKLHLIDGRNGQFTINANVVTAPCGETYASLIKKGVNNWNNAGAGVNYSYTTGSSYKIFFTTGDFGNSGYSGKTQFFTSSGRNVGDSSGNATANYSYTIIALNHYAFSRDPNRLGKSQGVQLITAHEMGHSLGLNHDNTGAQSGIANAYLMDPNIEMYYSNGSISFYTPRSDDVWGINELYEDD